MPCFNTRLIRRRGSIAFRVADLDGPIRLVLDVAVADFLAEAGQVLFLTALVHHEEDIDLIERIDRLHRDVIGIAGADADDENLSHLQASSTVSTGQTFSGKIPYQRRDLTSPSLVGGTRPVARSVLGA